MVNPLKIETISIVWLPVSSLLTLVRGPFQRTRFSLLSHYQGHVHTVAQVMRRILFVVCVNIPDKRRLMKQGCWWRCGWWHCLYLYIIAIIIIQLQILITILIQRGWSADRGWGWWRHKAFIACGCGRIRLCHPLSTTMQVSSWFTGLFEIETHS